MKKNTINAIQIAQESGLIVPFCSAVKNAKSAVGKGQIIGIWASRYEKSLIDALVDLYQPLEAVFKQIDGKCEGCFLFVNTASKSILCMYLGLYNKLNLLLLDKKIKPLEMGSKDWERFTKIDKFNALDSFARALDEFGLYARAYNELPLGVDSEAIDNLGNNALLGINRVFPGISWGDLNNQDAW